jgi:hypothetical protein
VTVKATKWFCAISEKNFSLIHIDDVKSNGLLIARCSINLEQEPITVALRIAVRPQVQIKVCFGCLNHQV